MLHVPIVPIMYGTPGQKAMGIPYYTFLHKTIHFR